MPSRSVTISSRLALLAVLALVGCGKDKDGELHVGTTFHGEAAPGDAAVRAAAGSPEELWEAYRAAHVGATVANAVETGRKLWPLLAGDARKMVGDAAAATIAALGSTKINVSAEEIGYKVLGETAAARAVFVASAKLTWEAKAGSAGGGTMRLAGKGSPLALDAVREGDVWRLAAGPGLLAGEGEVFRMPTGAEAVAGADSLDAISARWQDILAHGNGWDAYNVMSPAMRAKLLELVGNMGGSGAGDVARIFEKTVVDRRNNGITVTSATIEDRTDTRATIVLVYSNGKSDRFIAVRVDGKWWLEMQL